MSITKEKLQQEIEQFNDEQLQQIAEFIEFIKFRSRFHQKAVTLHKFATLYQEFAKIKKLPKRECQTTLGNYKKRIKYND